MGRRLKLNLDHALDEITKILLVGDSKLKTIDAYNRLLQILKQLEGISESDCLTCRHIPNLIGFISSQISSNDEDIGKLALNCISVFIQTQCCVSSISNKMAVDTLVLLVELIKSTKSQEMCKIGVECILAQKFEPNIVSSQLPYVLEGILLAVNNASLFVPDAFEALNRFSTKMAGRMRELAHMWAALIYEKLLSFEESERELAYSYLQKMREILLPPTPLLAKVVAENVQNKLLPNMQMMIESRNYKVPVINAWGWFIWLLGSHILPNRSLVNSMLKILEQTFLDADIDARIASQVAWKAMVDILLPAASENGMEKGLSEGTQEPLVHLTSKRMKLLIMPLVGTMTVEKSAKARNSCWRICVYILQKLSFSINKISVMQFILVPMFESIFKSGRNNWNMWVWDSCASLFEEFLSQKAAKNLRSVLPIEGPPIKWSPWMLCHVEYLLKIFGSVWKSYAADVAGNENRKIYLKFILRIWQLLLEGLDMEGKGATDPSTEHRDAVHLFLNFVNSISDEVALLFVSTHDRDLVFSLWCLLEYIVNKLSPLILVSSFYKLPLSLTNVNGDIVSTGVGEIATGPLGNNSSSMDAVQFEVMGTPIAYVSMVWLKFVANLSLHDRRLPEELHLKVDNCWLLCVWRAFIEHRLVVQEEKASDISCGNGFDSIPQYVLWLLLFPWLISSISKVKDILDNKEDPLPSNTIPSSGDLWFLSEDFSKMCSPTTCRLLLKISGDSQEHVMRSREKECPVQKNNLDVSKCSLLVNIRYDFAAIYGRFITCLLKETMQILNGRASLHPSGPDCTNEAGRTDETTMLTSALFLAARFLMLMHEAQKNNTKIYNAINRVCEALVSLSNSLQTQHDIISFVQTLSEPLAIWLCGCLGQKFCRRNSMLLNLDRNSSLKQTENYRRTCKIVTRNLDLENCTDLNGANTNEDRSILALVSRFLIIACEAQNYNSKIIIDSVSRVFDGLICFSSFLKAQNDALQFMQALSKPLVKWFSSPLHSDISDDTGQQMLLLEKIWYQLLASLQNCHPPISFDSDLLNLQAPLLASAFQCPLKSIADQTLLFWERTYGIKTCRLSYPSCLVPVLRDLQHKVKIALPGFLHTYVSRRGLKHQRKQQVQECCATGNAAPVLDVTDAHNEQGHANMKTVGGQTRIYAQQNAAVLDFKAPVSSEKLVEVKLKPGRPRKHKSNAPETTVLNNFSRKSIAGQNNSDLVENIAIKHSGNKKDASEGNADLNTKLNIPDENIELTKKKGRKIRKRKSRKHKPVLIGKKMIWREDNARSPLGSKQLDLGRYSKQFECIRNHSSGDHVLASKRVVSKESLEHAKGNLKQIGRRRKSEQLQIRLLTSDLKTLGIRHLRTLRNAGGLRGGKDWRTTHETAKQLPKMSRRQSQQFNAVDRNDFNTATETDINKQVLGTMSSMGIVDLALQKNKQGLQSCRLEESSSWTCSEADTVQKACQTSKESAPESPFKVRALGGRSWSGLNLSKSLEDFGHAVSFTPPVHSMPSRENNSDCGNRKNWRKRGIPKRIPSNFPSENKSNICYENNILSQVKFATDEERIFTRKRLKDAGHHLFTSNGWNSTEGASPFKKLKVKDSTCFVKNPIANFELENGRDPFYVTHTCQEDMTSSAGVYFQAPDLADGKSGSKSNLENGQWQQEGSIFDNDRPIPKNNPEELDARNEESSEAQSEATNQCTETEGFHTTEDQPYRWSNQVHNHDLQSSEEKHQLQWKTQRSQLNGSSGTSHEGCVDPSIVNPPEYACTSNGDTLCFSKKGLALLEEMGNEWNICDIISEISSSSKLQDLGRQDLINAEVLIVGLSEKIAERKKLLFKTR